MKRIGMLLAATVVLAGLAAPSAQAALQLEDLDLTIRDAGGALAMEAGSHPGSVASGFSLPTEPIPGYGEAPVESLRDIRVQLPPGLVGNPTAVPPCSAQEFREMGEYIEDGSNGPPPCGDESAVGVIDVTLGLEEPLPGVGPVYNVEPPPGAVLELGFIASDLRFTLLVKLADHPPYNAVVSLAEAPQTLYLYSSQVTIWGDPAASAHDAERGTCLETQADDLCPSGATRRPLLTLPRSCGGPLGATFEGDSWQQPGIWDVETALAHDDSEPPSPLGVGGCGALGFAARVASEPTVPRASSPSGLHFGLDIEDHGLTNPTGRAQSDLKKAVVTLPEGVTLNPSAGDGLAACTPAELQRETLAAAPGQGCPEAAKLGTVAVQTPLLEGTTLHGEVFLAQPDDPATAEPGAENPFDSFLALYMVIKDPRLGILIKLPGRVSADERSGQLTTTFGEAPYELPQFPFSHLDFDFRSGERAPLAMPRRCGTYETKVEFTPWANPADTYETEASFEIASGPGGGLCPSDPVAPFAPGFHSGTQQNGAGRYSPYLLQITRGDGEQEITRFSSVLPPGVLGRLAGVERCSDAAIAAARARSGREELASPSCPAGSRIGSLLAGAGVGGSLTYVPGSLYLGGPVGGDPFSIVAITPAVVGPFDVGNVVVREALALNPLTAEVEVDGSASEPFPRILRGVPVSLRDLRVAVDRPRFTLNATSCEPEQASGQVFGSASELFAPVEERPVAVAERYQAADCAALGFAPRLSLRLKGDTKRGGHPALKAVLKSKQGPEGGEANIGRAVVALPHSAFLAQSHIRTICTRVQFAAGNCPPGSVYGTATARTPLLDEPLSGPVYLRSSDNPLPDLVAALHGEVDIDLVGKIDSFRGGIRTTFAQVPDAPVSEFVLQMQGGRKGLIENSRNLCAARSRALAQMTGQNGRRSTAKPVVRPTCRAKKGKSGGKGR